MAVLARAEEGAGEVSRCCPGEAQIDGLQPLTGADHAARRREIGIVRLKPLYLTQYRKENGMTEPFPVEGGRPIGRHDYVLAPSLYTDNNSQIHLRPCHLLRDVQTVVAKHLWDIKQC